MVRNCMCRHLALISRGVGLDLTKVTLLPKKQQKDKAFSLEFCNEKEKSRAYLKVFESAFSHSKLGNTLKKRNYDPQLQF